jgi:hypothetical protein
MYYEISSALSLVKSVMFHWKISTTIFHELYISPKNLIYVIFLCSIDSPQLFG